MTPMIEIESMYLYPRILKLCLKAQTFNINYFEILLIKQVYFKYGDFWHNRLEMKERGCKVEPPITNQEPINNM